MVAAVLLALAPATSVAATVGAVTRVIVREQPGTGTAAERLVRDLGGTVVRRIDISRSPLGECPRASSGAAGPARRRQSHRVQRR